MKVKVELEELIFPRKIGFFEVKRLCKYIVVNLEGNCNVTINTYKHEFLGVRTSNIKPMTLKEVPIDLCDAKIYGSVIRTNDQSNIPILFSVDYSEKESVVFNGIFLNYGNSYMEESDKGTGKLIMDLKETIKGYFDK